MDRSIPAGIAPAWAAPSAAAFLIALTGSAAAQTAATLPQVTVTGNPLGATDLVAPAASYSGQGLLLRSQTTIGETLNNTPGVSSTYFGPNASRPVIRGLDADRIRILSNSGATIDASSLSYDHAVTAEPITIERIEVLRGPAALLYGGNAIGGVVNVIDGRIPREPVDGVTGKVDLGLASANRERGGGVLVEGGNNRFGLHVDAFDRMTGDVRVPAALACTQGGALRIESRICNSASHVKGGAFGGSVFFDRGFLGASVSSYRNNYGTVAEDEVTIDMRSTRYAVEGEMKNLGGWIQSVKGQLSHTDYQHTEFEAAAPGTVFKNNGGDFRLEARHAKAGPLEGVIGLQGESTRFSADGAEAFAPFSKTSQLAMFLYEELGTSWGKFNFGARTESVRVESLGNPSVPRFVPATRQFRPTTFSAGALWNVASNWQVTGNIASSQRAPKDNELFADGQHIATAAYEVGDAGLGKERSTNIDVGVQWKSGANHFKVTAFNTRFSNYVALLSTGQSRELLPEFAYSPVRARFRGLEAGGNLRLLEGASKLDLELRGDIVRADNLTTDQPLPRIAPMRVGATLAWTHGSWGARVGFDRMARQDRVPAGELATPGFALFSAALTYRMKAGASDLLWYARLDNAGDTLAYSATSILTQTAPGKSPLPGRNLKFGMQAAF